MKKLLNGSVFVVCQFFLLVLISSACQEKKNTIHESTIESRIIDSVNLLDINQRKALYTQVQDIEKLGPQVAIIIVDTLRGRTILDVSMESATRLELGRKEYRDGLLLFVALKNHEIRLEVGYGLERIIKDEIASRIIREEISPRFRDQQYQEGLSEALREIEKLIKDKKELIGKP